MAKESEIQFKSLLENLEQVKKRLTPKEVAVLYSGGGDSLLVADLLGGMDHFSRVHLITYDNGAVSRLELAAAFVEELKRRHGEERIIHQFRTNAELFRNLALNQHLVEDIQKYGNNYLCIGCKMAMHADLIAYSLLNGVGNIADGYNTRQKKFPEQTDANIESIRGLAEAYGIRYHTPLAGLVQTQMEKVHGLGIRGLHTQSVQPSCLFAASFKNLEGNQDEADGIRDYIVRRAEAVCTYIDHAVSIGLAQKAYDGSSKIEFDAPKISF